MRLTQQLLKMGRNLSPGSVIRHHYFGALSIALRPILSSVLLTIAVTMFFLTGCSSTGTNFAARLVSPAAANDRNVEDQGSYQPPRSPGFNDLFGS
jgi:hypothetical protein